ncbi:nucleoside monophosphate kinase [Methanobacterium oryzae]|uniref:nucleoside monophosphate kinase n=1 Tax=Methanobacterium oryzae TaxID=69540 RepID=UPI003D1A398C
MHVIGVTGLPGSGKSIVARVAKNLEFDVIRMGDVIRDEAIKRNADIGETAVKLREEYGKFVVAERCVEIIKESMYNTPKENDLKYIIEGIRSPAEVKIFKNNFRGFKVIAVHSNPNTRFMRVKKRKRSDDSDSFHEFKKRDNRELKFGIGNVIATSDFMIVNEGPIWKYKNSIRSILKTETKKRTLKNIKKKKL